MKRSLLLYCCLVTGLAAQSDMSVVGVISDIYWNGGYADPIMMSCQVSTDNKNELVILTYRDLTNTRVTFEFTIMEYDRDERIYYPCFHADGAQLEGLILKEGGEFSLAIDDIASGEVVSPQNFTFNIGIMPEEIQQNLHLAFSVSQKLVKQWGISITAKAARTQAEISYSCDVYQGFNFQSDFQGNVGYLNSMTIGETELAADFTVIDPEDPGSVPVELTGFSAVRDGRDVLLTWTTATEVNNLGFDVYRSCGGEYVRLNTALVPGTGTAAVPQEYGFVDRTAPAGDCTYRLKQMDADGTVRTIGSTRVDIGVADIGPRPVRRFRPDAIDGTVYTLQGSPVGGSVRPGVYLVEEDGTLNRVLVIK